MKNFLKFLRTEVPIILGATQAIISLIIALGFHLSPGVQGTILAVSAALFALITRSQVTPIITLIGNLVKKD